MMGLARSTFYEIPKHSADDTAIVEAMAAICDEFEHYGWRRVRAALRQQGLVVNHKKIRRLMREHDLQPKIRRRFSSSNTSIARTTLYAHMQSRWNLRVHCGTIKTSV